MLKGKKFHNALRDGLKLKGRVVEIGVCKGYTFIEILRVCTEYGVIPVAVDSWEGMAEPGRMDTPLGVNHYPKGLFNMGGVEGFHQAMQEQGVQPSEYVAVQGWVPAVLNTLELTDIGFAHIDLDHFQPTLDAARWVWPRLVVGGSIAFHDWFPAKRHLAAAAISIFLSEVAEKITECVHVGVEGDELILTRLISTKKGGNMPDTEKKYRAIFTKTVAIGRKKYNVQFFFQWENKDDILAMKELLKRADLSPGVTPHCIEFTPDKEV